jgi:hypothetical protein
LPFDTTIDPATGFRTHVLSGVVTQEEIEEGLAKAYARPDFRPEADILCDIRDADLRGMSRDVIRDIVGFVSARRSDYPQSRTAVVVGRDLDFGLARMYEQLIESVYPANVTVFRDLDEAQGWLDSAATVADLLQDGAEE